MRLDGGVLVKGDQGVIVNSVMGDNCIPFIPAEKSSSEEDLIRMCPLTSSIMSSTESSTSTAASSYPRRILLSFLRSRKRLAGGQGNKAQPSNQNSHNQIAMISNRSVSKAFSQKEASDLRREKGARMQSESEYFGEMCNHCVSSDQIPIPTTSQSDLPLKSSSQKCTCCRCTPQTDISSYPLSSSTSSSASSCHQINSRFDSSSLSHSNLSNAAAGTTHHSLRENANKLCHHNSNSTKETGSEGLSSLSSSSSSLVYQLCRKASNLCVGGGGGGGNFKVFLVLFTLFLISSDHLAQACGPGRGAGRRRAPRKLTPLVYKQHVPNFSENTLSASGFTEGRITRKDAKFKNLVPNYNQDIIFRDEEGTGADRLMTQRCKEKLNTLAISVMNQWPGVKLRVIEGWDEELHHATHSLHYEGRAVDITTSDKDRSKYGMLARLAVEAGFDWVYYESRAHIHCSVKSDSSQASRTGGCFTANSTVETPSGPRKMEEIKVGDKIRTIDDSGKEVFSDVLMFLDRNGSETREFYELTTESGASLTLTPSHLLYSIKPEDLNPDDEFLLTKKNSYLSSQETSKYFLDQAEITFAKYVQLGDWLLVKSHHHKGDYTVEKVISIELRVETGVYAPLTSTGNLVVDGVLTSCYALIQDQTLAHVAFAPVRLAHNFRQSVTYLWRQFSRFISFKSHSLPHHPSENSIESSEQDVKFNKPVSSSSSTTTSSWESRSSSSTTNLVEDQLSNQGIHWYASFLYSTFRYVLPASLLYD